MKKNQNLVLGLLASSSLVMLLTTTVSCKKAEEPAVMKSFDMTAAEKSIDSSRVAFVDAFNKGDASGVAALYMTDAKFMPPHTAAKAGTEAIKAEIDSYFKQGITKLDIKIAGIWGDENMLSEESTWAIFDKDGKEMDHGKSLVTYKKADGHWRIFRDCYNSDLPCTPPPTSEPKK